MGKIIISENVSLDGVIQDPAGDEGFRHGGWAGRPAAREQTAQILLNEALGTQALLFGRRSYEFFAARWPSRTGALADRLNSLPKYIVSSTLQDPAWNNSTILKGDAVDEISKLKQKLDGDIVVYASFQLVRPLIEHDLVDELRLMVYPVVLGPASASSARPATRSPCASPATGPSMTASPFSPTNVPEKPSGEAAERSQSSWT